MAWDPESIETFLHRYAAIRGAGLPRETAISRIRELLRMREKIEERAFEDWINVPLYRFGAPAIAGASVDFSEGESLLGGAGWSLKVFGIGTGHTATLQVSKARTYSAKAGTCKVVLVPVKLRVARVAILDRGRLVGRGYEAEVAATPQNADPHLHRRQCRLLPPNACAAGPAESTDTLDYALSGDTTDAVHRDRRTWEVDVAHEVSAQLKTVADVSALVRVKRTRRFELSFALPAGHDYLAHMCAGITWWVRPAMAPAAGAE
jgi:hypothetical protein